MALEEVPQLLFDTGPIWEQVLFRAVDELGFEGLRRELRFRDRTTFERYIRFIASFKARFTTASVVAEIYCRIRRQFERKNHREMRGVVYEELQNMAIDEELIKLLEMPIEKVVSYGPVDVSVIELARRRMSSGQRLLVLTIDSDLWDECEGARIDARLLEQVLSDADEYPRPLHRT